MTHLIAENRGGDPRYIPDIKQKKSFRYVCDQLVVQGKRRITDYLSRS